MDIVLEQDMSVETGHQVIVLDDSVDSMCLAKLLSGETLSELEDRLDGDTLRIPHTAEVDRRLVMLIDQLAHVRFSAPGLVQMTMEEASKP